MIQGFKLRFTTDELRKHCERIAQHNRTNAERALRLCDEITDPDTKERAAAFARVLIVVGAHWDGYAEHLPPSEEFLMSPSDLAGICWPYEDGASKLTEKTSSPR